MMSCPPGAYVDPSAACPSEWPVIRLQQSIAASVEFQLVDAGGNNLSIPEAGDVPDVDDDPDPGDSPTIIVVASGTVVGGSSARLWMKEHATATSVVEVEGTLTADGLVTLEFSAENLSFAGIYCGTILLVNDEDEIVWAKNVFIDIEPNATAGCEGQPVTIAEIRMLMRDVCSDGGFMLDSVEASDRELALCLRRPVDEWNETPPPVATFTYRTFPYRYWHSRAATAEVLLLLAHRYDREHLSYSAAGVSIDDQNKAPSYRATAQQLRAEWREWMKNTKIAINVGMAWGVVPGRWTR